MDEDLVLIGALILGAYIFYQVKVCPGQYMGMLNPPANPFRIWPPCPFF